MRKTPKLLRVIEDIISMVPPLNQWSVEITDDSGVAVPAEFRVFVDDEGARITMRHTLGLGRPAEQTDISETHNYSPYVVITIIEV
jgi:hypothetical protein